MSVLIVAGREDVHASAVEHALGEKGVVAWRLASDHFTQISTMSAWLGKRAAKLALRLDDQFVALESVHTVWNRRPYELIETGPVGVEDVPFARREACAAREGVYRLLTPARWVNPFESVARAENKIYQLTCASQLGLRIPETLIGNDPNDVRAFLRSKKDCIYKPLHGHVWQQSGRRRATYTAAVSESVLPTDALLRAVPGIYQERVDYAFEVRAQFFGRQCAAIKIDVPLHGGTDWRYEQSAIDHCDQVFVPKGLQVQCHELMRKLGLLVAGFDFLVTDDDQWIFLELNQAGQFLFLEDWCPELPILDMFCEFLRNPSPRWEYVPSRKICQFVDFVKAYKECSIELARPSA